MNLVYVFGMLWFDTNPRRVSTVNGTFREKGETYQKEKPITAVNGDMVKQINVLITVQRRITIAKLYESFQIYYGCACSLLHFLGCSHSDRLHEGAEGA